MVLSHFKISLDADIDLEDIYDYTFDNFGEKQAIKYLLELETLFSLLVENPLIGKVRSEIKVGLFSFPKDSHIIFYRIMTGNIRIVRVLHGSKDLPKLFENEF
jgi:toxin ParE1/3/4